MTNNERINQMTVEEKTCRLCIHGWEQVLVGVISSAHITCSKCDMNRCLYQKAEAAMKEATRAVKPYEGESPWLPTRNGYEKMVHPPVRIVDGCVDNSKRLVKEKEGGNHE